MKRLIFIMLFVFAESSLMILKANTNASINIASRWYGVTKFTSLYTGTSFNSVTYYLQGDTVINDTTYQSLWRDNGDYCAGLRLSVDSQQVYIRPTERLMSDYWVQGDQLMYDFNVQVGDTVYAIDGSYAGIDNMGTDVSIQYRWIVQDVQTIDGRKHVRVEGGQTYHQVEWIEGIGSQYILFENEYDGVLGTYSTYALCAANSEGNILYSFNTDYIGIRNNCPDWEPIDSAIDNLVQNTPSATKIFRDGQILILRGGGTYTLTGQRME